jgi:predicted RNA-binding protein with PIN domain
MQQQLTERDAMVRSARDDAAEARRSLAATSRRDETMAALGDARAALARAEATLAAAPRERTASAQPMAKRERIRPAKGLLIDSADGVAYLFGVAGVAVVVDGYNVAKLAWPDVDLEQQRQRLDDVVREVVARHRCDVTVVYDGADVTGANRARRTFAVVFSPTGVLADDVIIEHVRSLPIERAVVVVTSDRELRRRCEGLGATAVASDVFLRAIGRAGS